MSRYFPDNQNTPQEQLERPEWAKGVGMTPDARETPARHRDRKWMRAKFQGATDKAFVRLLELLDHEDGRVGVKAAQLILEYGWGKPEQQQPDGAPDQRRATADPEALRGRIVAVLAEVGPAEKPGRAGEVIDALPARRPVGG